MDVTLDGDWAVVRLMGEIDVSNAPEIREQVERLQEDGIRNIRFDVSGVEFVDSQAFNMLAVVHKRAKKAGGRMEVTRASPGMRRLFQLSGLELFLVPGEGGLGPTDSVA